MAGVLYLAWSTYTEQFDPSAATDDAVRIPASAWEGLEKCGISPALFEIQNSLLATASPLRKEESLRSYKVSGEFLGLRVREMEIGVCPLTGTRDCGWGSYVGVVMDLPLPEVRQNLQVRFGIDYTQEQRDDEVEATERPVLSEDKQTGRTRLHCDPGTL